MRTVRNSLLGLCAFLLCATIPWHAPAGSLLESGDAAAARPPALLPATASATWVDSTLAELTLDEKIGQLVMGAAYGHYLSTEGDEYARLERLVRDLKLGGVIMFQGDVYEEAVVLNKLQALAKIPLLVSADLERGLAMRVRRGTYFPDAMAIGATRKKEYAYTTGLVTAHEARALGIHQNYAPVADINDNPNNPVINTRAFSDDRELVAAMVEAYVRGTQDGGAIATAKHFPGHGDTGIDSHLDLPSVPLTRTRIDSVEFMSFRRAIAGGVKSVMVGHLEVPALDPSPGLPATLSPVITTDILKQDLGFDGLVVTDAMVMAGVAKGYSVGESSVRAFTAGADIILLPADEAIAINALRAAVTHGEISEARLNASVRKILSAKYVLGLHESRFVDIEKISERVGTREHWNLASEIAREAITVVRNKGGILPLPHGSNKRIVSVIISDTDHNRTEVNRQAFPYPNEVVGSFFAQELQLRHPELETVRIMPSCNQMNLDGALATVRQSDVVLLALYVKVRTSTGKIGIPQTMRDFLTSVADLKKPTIVVTFGNPYLVDQFPKADALLCAYSDAEVLVESSVMALFGEIPVRGKLPVHISQEFALGSGLSIPQTRLRPDDPGMAGFDARKLMKIDAIVTNAIRDSAFPGAQVLVAKSGMVVYNKSFGTYTYDKASREVNHSSMYDLASLTKVVATTNAVMKLHDEGRIRLEDRVGSYIPQFAQGKKSIITVRHLLTHSSGLPPFRRLWEFCRDGEAALDSVYATELVASPGDTMIYSDLGMITMGKIVEMVTGLALNEYVAREFFDSLGMKNTMFTPPAGMRPRIVPTEVDSAWRRSLVHGIVHDENAAFLGGVSGHAGLFSTASDLAVLMQMLMNKGTYGGRRYLKEETVREFTRKQGPSSSRAIGWDTKSPTGSSAGTLLSPTSFGHTGFTGTSIWADPERDIFVIFLTNRVHPTRATTKIFRVRPALHDAVIQALN